MNVIVENKLFLNIKERRLKNSTQVAQHLREDFKQGWYILKVLVAKYLKSSDPTFEKLTTHIVIEESIN